MVGSEIYVFGGFGANLLNYVWKSTGSIWDKVLADNNATSTVQFSQRDGHSSVVLGRNMYVIGGRSSGSYSYLNDVWTSTDGKRWTEVTTSAVQKFPARAGHSSVVLGNKIYLIGGFTLNTSGYIRWQDVWKSKDGKKWEEVTTPTSQKFPKRSDHSSVVRKDEIYVIGGASQSKKRFNDVWESADGKDWKLVTPAAPFSARDGLGAVVVNDTIYVIGGFAGGKRFNDVWKSTDGGENWVNVHAK